MLELDADKLAHSLWLPYMWVARLWQAHLSFMDEVRYGVGEDTRQEIILAFTDAKAR